MLSGSSLATAATMGRIALPEMREAGYPMSLSSGAVAAGGTLGILIPPSTILVIYAFLAEQSIKDLMLATFGPILVGIACYSLAIWLAIRLGWERAPRVARAGREEQRAAVREILPPVGIFALIMGGLYSGFFTANETAAVGVAVVFVYGILSRRLDLEAILAAARSTAKTSGALYLVIIGANLFNFYLTLSGLPFALTGIFEQFVASPLMLILVMTGIYFLLGSLMDSLAMLLLTVPLFVPIVQLAGIDLIWFGIYVVLVIEIGLITPPVGMNLFVLKATQSELRLLDIWRGVVPFVLADIIRISILIAVPAIALWVPYAAR